MDHKNFTKTGVIATKRVKQNIFSTTASLCGSSWRSTSGQGEGKKQTDGKSEVKKREKAASGQRRCDQKDPACFEGRGLTKKKGRVGKTPEEEFRKRYLNSTNVTG